MRETQRLQLPDGRTLGYAEFGAADGRPLLFFHGWPSSRLQGRGFDRPARACGLRLIAPDRPGIGLSDPLPGRRFGDWPADVAALADALGIGRFLLLAVSGGTPYALATATQLPGRVAALAVASGAPPLDRPADRRSLHTIYRGLAAAGPLRRALVPAALASGRWMVDRGQHRPPLSWLMQTVAASDRRALAEEGAWDSVTASFLDAVRNGPEPVLEEGELYLQPWDFDPAQVLVPVSFWHGTADQNLPWPLIRRLAGSIPGARCHWIEGCGHYALPARHGGEILEDLARLAD